MKFLLILVPVSREGREEGSRWYPSALGARAIDAAAAAVAGGGGDRRQRAAGGRGYRRELGEGEGVALK